MPAKRKVRFSMRLPGWMRALLRKCKRWFGGGISRAFVSRGLIDKSDSEEMGGWEHGGGFSVDASVRIEGAGTFGSRYCARPPFSLEHLQQFDAEHLVYHCPKSRPDGPSELVLTPLELIDTKSRRL